MNSNFPKEKIKNQFRRFVESEQASGIVLIVCTIISLIVANSAYGSSYSHFWHLRLGPEQWGLNFKIEQWINDGLMALFFLLVGLEIKREIIEGELANIRQAMLPIMAALGGMIIPAVLYSLFNHNTRESIGWGIPMATDIAFAVGVLSLLGKRIPFALKVMLTALAIVDDLGAIIVIALFYSNDISFVYLGCAALVLVFLFVLNRLKVEISLLYIIPGIILWYLIFKSGVHATIAGVLFALVLPLGKGDKDSVAEKLEHHLDFPVAFVVMPLFALCNTGFVLNTPLSEIIATGSGLGIILGLFIGKPFGIFTFSYLTIKSGLASLPERTVWRQLLGIGFLGGIGFTMSIFITLLAFEDPLLQSDSKVAILTGSILAGVMGYLLLRVNEEK